MIKFVFGLVCFVMGISFIAANTAADEPAWWMAMIGGGMLVIAYLIAWRGE